MPACHAGDRGFESRQFRHYATVAQSVEQRTENPRVGGSIPSRGTMLIPAAILAGMQPRSFGRGFLVIPLGLGGKILA